MKRDFLEGFGLSKDDVDAILTENGRNLEGLRQQIRALSEENEKWKETAAAYDKEKQTASEELARLRLTESDAKRFRETVIGRLVSEARPASASAERDVRRRLAEETADGGDLYEALDRIRREDPGAFLKDPQPDRPIFSVFSRRDNPLAAVMPPIPAL